MASAAALLLFLAASEQLPPTWDEGDTAARADSVLAWAGRAFSPDSARRGSLWSAKTLRCAFPNTTSREGHPAGYVILTAAGKQFSEKCRLAGRGRLLSEKTAYRFGVIFLWSLALGAVFGRLEKSFSVSAACFGLFSVIFLPRVFTHAQIAFGDSPLISGWLLTWAFFPRTDKRIRFWLAWGVFLGLTASAKFTGALAAFPFLLWTLCRKERRRSLIRLALGTAAALGIFLLFNPPLWHAPISGLIRYISLNTHRETYNIGILFLGQLYSLGRPLPWWNALFWTAVTVPAGILVSAAVLLAAAGGRRFCRKQDSASCVFLTDERRGEILLLFLNWFILIAVRSVPGLPVHDGVRLFAAALPFFAILGGLGLARLWAVPKLLPRTAAMAVLLGSGSSLLLYFPQGLSYYNLLIGGLPGAARAGMEVTYYWDGLDREISTLLKQEAPEHEARPSLLSSASPATLRRWQKWEQIPAPPETISALAGNPDARRLLAETPFRWYILQNRASGLTPIDRKLLRARKPVFIKTAGTFRTPGFLKKTPWALNRVPLILIYRYEDFYDEFRTTEKEAVSSQKNAEEAVRNR